MTASETTQDTSQSKDAALAKYADSNLQVIEDQKLTDEQWVEKSWEFLDQITSQIERLPQEIQQKILELGRALAKVGAAYLHDQNRPHYPPVSPAKAASLKELKKNSTSASPAQ